LTPCKLLSIPLVWDFSMHPHAVAVAFS